MSDKLERRTIEQIKRLNNSVNGNPRYEFAFTDGTSAKLSSDSGFGYEVGNPGYRAGDTVDVAFTRAGRVRYMKTPPDRTDLTDQDKTVMYQLEKVDQGGEVMDLFEEREWAVADALGLEVDDDEESPGFMSVKIGEDRWATLAMRAVVFDSQGDTQAQVFIASRFTQYADFDPLDVDPTEDVIGVYSSEDSAWQATAEDAAEALETYAQEAREDGEPEDEAFDRLDQHSWDVKGRPILD